MKLVREHINEKFSDDSDPIKDLGIGEYNRYAFIGYTDKKPVTINGKKYYEDEFQVESMIKIDRYSAADMASIGGMKMRHQVQYGGHSGEHGVYYVDIPKWMMDEDYYSKIPKQHRDIIEKYKVKIKI